MYILKSPFSEFWFTLDATPEKINASTSQYKEFLVSIFGPLDPPVTAYIISPISIWQKDFLVVPSFVRFGISITARDLPSLTTGSKVKKTYSPFIDHCFSLSYTFYFFAIYIVVSKVSGDTVPGTQYRPV